MKALRPRGSLWRFWPLGLWLVLVGLLAAKLSGQTADDFFITFRYAQNLLAGNGFVFNPGEAVFGTTAPGWALLLAAVGGLTSVSVPVLATWGTAAALFAVAAILLLSGVGGGRFWECVSAGSLALSAAYFWVHNGSEAFVLLALLVLAARLGERAPVWAGLLAGFCAWLRPEAVLAAGILFLWLSWERRRPALRFAWAAGITVVVGLAAALFHFGTPLPNTLGAKRLQVAWQPETWAGGWRFWVEGWRWLVATYAGPYTFFLVAGGLLGQVSLLRTKDRALGTLALFGGALAVAYPVLGVPFYTWYLIPILLPWLYGLCFLVGDLVRWGARKGLDRPASWVAIATAAVLLLPFAAHTVERTALGYRAFRGIPQIELYRTAGTWLRQEAPEAADVAHVEVGALAYYSQRPVRDLLGLVSPEALPFVAEGDLTGALKDRSPMFFVDHSRLRPLTGAILENPWFRANYEPVRTFEAELSGDSLVLYRRRDG